jgi:hypothetical protein
MVIGIFRYVERLNPQDKQIVSICVLYKFYEIKSIQKSIVCEGFEIREWEGDIRYSLLEIGDRESGVGGRYPCHKQPVKRRLRRRCTVGFAAG